MFATSPQMSPSEFDAFTRLDFVMFIERVFVELNAAEEYLGNFHIEHMAAELEAMRRGETRRLMISLPPRNLKSLIASVAFSAWLLGQNPASKILHVTYGRDLTEDFALQVRQVIQSVWYRRLFPKTRLSAAQQAATALRTTAGGRWLAKSVGGAITGRGADFIIIDDPIKPEDVHSDVERNNVNRWYRTTLITRLNNKKSGSILMVMQRLHVDDPVGHVAKIEAWKVISLAAIAPADETFVIPSAFGTWTHHRKEGEALHPEREPLDILEGLREIQGVEYFSAQYQQCPVVAGGNIVKLDQLQRFDLDNPPVFERTVHSWDTANKSQSRNGYSVCTVWGIVKQRIYLIDVIRGRFQFGELRDKALALSLGKFRGHRRPDVVLIEDKASGQSLIQELKRVGIHTVTGIIPVADKITRINDQTGVIADGCVFVPLQAPWLPAYLDELIAFPICLHKDQVDSTSQVLKWFNHQPNEPAIITYYRLMVEEKQAAKARVNDEYRIVSLRPTDGVNYATGLYGAAYNLHADGTFKMPWFEAEILLKRDGWSLAEGAELLLDLGAEESVTGVVAGTTVTN